METLLPENLCAHRKGAIAELIKGRARDTAAQLHGKPTDHDGPEELLVKQFTSFTESLSHVWLSSCEHCDCEVSKIPNQVRSPIGDQIPVNSGESCKRPAAEDLRGCSKRRSYSPNNPSQIPLLEPYLRSCSSETFSDSESDSRSFSSIAISTQYTSSRPSSAASVRSFSSETISTQDSESYAQSFSSETISTQYTSSLPSSASSVRNEWGEESRVAPNVGSLMKHLRYLSLQGNSRIKELPISVSKLANLETLDLRACPALENIPGEIGLVKNLRCLFMSNCYLLHHMPKEISYLLKLEVLKGFVVGNSMEKEDSCTLEHLAKLTKLRVLNIYTRRNDFPGISDLRDLNRLNNLLKLKIEWGAVSVHKSENSTKVDNSSEESPAVENDASPELPLQLEKLHLECLRLAKGEQNKEASYRKKATT